MSQQIWKQRVDIFCCYAHEDVALLEQLKKHLNPLERQSLINLWCDHDISAGATWEQEISQHLNTAQVILLLVSPDFMSSEYCYSTEMKRAMERHALGQAHVIPIILHPCLWQCTPLSKLQALPTPNAEPVTSWKNPNEAFTNVAQEIQRVVEELRPQVPEKPSISEQGPDAPEREVNVQPSADDKTGQPEGQKTPISHPLPLTRSRMHLGHKSRIILVCVLILLVPSSLLLRQLAFHQENRPLSKTSTHPTDTVPANTLTPPSTTTPLSLATASSSPIAINTSTPPGWHALFSPFSPTCNDPNGIVWKRIAGSTSCKGPALTMQQTSPDAFAELDLAQVNGTAFGLSTFRIQVQLTFQEPIDPYTDASLYVQMPHASQGNSNFLFELFTRYNVGTGWDVQSVKTGKTVQGTKQIRQGDVINPNSGLMKTGILALQVLDGVISYYINGDEYDHEVIGPNTSDSMFGLMVDQQCPDQSCPSSQVVEFSHFELDVSNN